MQNERVVSVVDIFVNVLGGDEKIEPDTDFFESGGNSVLAARAIARIRADLGVRLSMRDIFTARTAHGLAEKIAEKAGS